MRRSRLVHAFVVITLLAVAPFLFGHRALAVEDPDYRVLFGPVGITTGERALVNVYAIGNPNDIGDPNETPWTFVVRLFDRSGVLVQERTFRLAAGAIGSVDLAVPGLEPGISVPAIRRTTFRAEIVGFNPQPDPPGKWAATLEVVDRLSGRTSLLIGNPDVLPPEQQVPPPGSN